jgi:predicted PurR-regulated permease PerM
MSAEPVPPTEAGARTTRAAWITLAVLLAVAAALCFVVLRPFIKPLLTGAVLAVVFFPLHAWIRKRVPGASRAALLTTIVVVVVFLAPMVFLVSIVIQQLRSAFEGAGPGALNDGVMRLWNALQGPLETLARWFGTSVEEMLAGLGSRIQEGLTAGARRVLTLITAATGGVIDAIIAIGALYVSLRDGPSLYEKALAHSPLGAARTRRLTGAAESMIVASFYGVIAVAAAQGILTGLACWAAGLPAPAVWGLAAGVASVLPLVGSALAWLPAAAVLFYQGSVGWGVFMLVWGAVVVANSDNIVRPLVLMSRMPANGLVILITLLGGVQAFGLIGVLFGPVILAVTMALLDFLREEMERSS